MAVAAPVEVSPNVRRFQLGTPASSVCLPSDVLGNFSIFTTVNSDVEDSTAVSTSVEIDQTEAAIPEKTLVNNVDSTTTVVYRADVMTTKVGYSRDAMDAMPYTGGDAQETGLGEVITYKIEYDNIGNVNADDTVIVEKIPEGACIDVDSLEMNKPGGTTITYLDANDVVLPVAAGVDCNVREVQIYRETLPAPANYDQESCTTQANIPDFADFWNLDEEEVTYNTCNLEGETINGTFTAHGDECVTYWDISTLNS